MTPKGLMMLAIATAAAVAGAALSAGAWQTGNGEESRGERFLPELADQANRIDSIRVRTGGWQVSLAKRGERFVDASGFPARLETIRDLVTGLAGLTIEERKTARPERYAELEVDAPGSPNSSGRRVELSVAGKRVADLVVGKRDPTVGGTQGGQFARRSDSATSWLLRGAANLPESRAGWFDTTLFEAASDRIAGVRIVDADGHSLELRPKGKGLEVIGAPDGSRPDSGRIDQIRRVLEKIHFVDVRAAATLRGVAPGTRIELETADGVGLSLGSLDRAAKADARWVRVTARPLRAEAKAATQKIVDRVTGFDFLLGAQAAEALGWQTSDLIASTAPSN